MLQTHRVRTLDQVRSFLAGTEPVEVQPLDRSARYEFVARTLRRFGYWQLGKADKGVVRGFVGKVSGLSRAQLTRLIAQHRSTGCIRGRRGPPRRPFPRRYTREDVRLLAQVELTQFRGPLTLWGGGIHHAEIETAVPAGLPAPDGLRVALARTGRTPEGLAREFEPSVRTIRNRVAQADRDAGRHADGLSTAEREEIRQLRRENCRLREERAMLAKSTAWSAARACRLQACPGASGGGGIISHGPRSTTLRAAICSRSLAQPCAFTRI